MKVESIPAQLIGYEFKNQVNTNRIIEENQKIINDFFGKSNQYIGTDFIGRKLDLSSLIEYEGGYLKGNLSDINDVDYFKFSVASYRNLNMIEQYNKDIIITLDNIPKDCNYEIILYDENGNQVGIGTENENGGKRIIVPNWNNSTEFYVKVVSQDNVNVNEDYHISFSTKPASQSNGAYLQNQEKQKYLSEFRKKLHYGKDYTQEKEALIAIEEKYQKIYEEKLNELHESQMQQVCKEGESINENNLKKLLDKFINEEELTDLESKLIQIYANASEYDQARAIKNLNTTISKQFFEILENEGIEVSNEILVQVGQDGKVMVSGNTNREDLNRISEIIEKNFTKILWENYICASEDTNQLTIEEKEVLQMMVDIETFLNKATGGEVKLSDLSVKTNGYIEGLAGKISLSINYPNNTLGLDIQKVKKFYEMDTNDSLSLCKATFMIKENKLQIMNGSMK
ncbi:prepilin peptidase dependent protein A [Candidatus Galacturonibacter soehngenii]|uniref:Prepilin peptidase dependent protein A n=1 Tax=Candidatus Galacturonatibacter soehngenii TaxID=2307010 RepID=A0A7V7QM75_9FIRM|nr:prepilin peptidase dependent protein A [Candidatus Galacturonibacter soehngenii]KAB1439470.1 prepilin peptidase dependent protein A [Candidatus Galacturonibacter soehngenii]